MTAYFRGQGGAIFAMDLPLPKIYQQQVTKGYLRRVEADGSPYREPAEVPDTPAEVAAGTPERPAQSAPKAEWVGYAVHVGGMQPDDAEALTKQDLIDQFGKE